MMQDNRYALLISGDEKRFADEALRFQAYLVDEARFDRARVRVVLCTYGGVEYIIDETRSFFTKMTAESAAADAVILYTGHGGQGSFFPNRSDLGYDAWVYAIAEHGGRILFLNNSCYSGSSVRAFKGLFPAGRCQVVTSSSEDELSYGDVFINKMLEAVRERRPFRRRKLGTAEVVGEQVVTFPKGATRHVDENGEEVEIIDSLDFTVREIRYRRPKILGNIQHPRQYGSGLEHLIFRRMC